MADRNLRPIRGPRKDITGQKFGRWQVLSFAGNSFWNCRCDCGTEGIIRGPHLKSGHSRSCGCLKSELSSKKLSADLLGKKFGRLLVLSRAESKNYSVRWQCRCDCGAETTVTSHRLTTGYTQSCGCLQRERTRTHGKSRTRTYNIWMHMRQRCENPRSDSWARYGGRGITVCDRWRDFTAFFEDMGEAPAGHSLDRIDVNGNYEPGNCRWATSRQQLRNTRRNKVVNLNGEQVLLTDAIAMLRKEARLLNS